MTPERLGRVKGIPKPYRAISAGNERSGTKNTQSIDNRWLCATWSEASGMARTERYEIAGVTLALAAAGLHLVWGVPRFVVYLRLGRFTDLRPPLFIVSAVIVVVAAIALYQGTSRRLSAGVLIGVMVGYLAGYVAWHLLGHPIIIDGSLQSHFHPDNPASVVIAHLQNDTFALATAIVELLAIGTLSPLLRPTDHSPIAS
jgi:predicted membrane channel-forming protein YqfA (hemolysin III family)